jgi:hypothetical protein
MTSGSAFGTTSGRATTCFSGSRSRSALVGQLPSARTEGSFREPFGARADGSGYCGYQPSDRNLLAAILRKIIELARLTGSPANRGIRPQRGSTGV